MNNFGLGIVLDFTDNATNGMKRVSQAFNEMNSIANTMVDYNNRAMLSVHSLVGTGYALNTVGDNLTRVGSNLNRLMMGTVKNVTDTGTEVLGYRMTLNSLFKEVGEGEKAFKWIQQFAQRSVFNVQDLLPAFTTMKAVGIDVREEIKTTSGEMQNLLMFAGDLAAVFPNMRNSYGTGVRAAMGAMKEYIAEGNKITLKRGAGLDIEGLLGEKKGKTIEERTRQVADLIEKIGAIGMTKALEGTPMLKLSNMEDFFYNLMIQVSDSGVFKKYTEVVSKMADYLFNIPMEEVEGIAKIFADSIKILIKPVEVLVSFVIKLIDAFRFLAREYPSLAKFVTVMTATSGLILLTTGLALKFGGALFMVAGALAMMKLNAAMGISILEVIRKGFISLSLKILPVITALALFGVFWKANVFGIRDKTIKVFKDIVEVLKILGDALDDDTLTPENLLKVNSMGLKPLVETAIEMKYIFKEFFTGMYEGFTGVFEYMNETAKNISKINLDMIGINKTVGELLEKIIGKDGEEKSHKLGKALGTLTGGLLIFTSIAFVSTKALQLIAFTGRTALKVVNLLKVGLLLLGGGLKIVFGVVATIFKTVLLPIITFIYNGVMAIVGVVASILGVSSAVAGALVAVAVALVALIIYYREEIVTLLMKVWEKIKIFGKDVKNKIGEIKDWFRSKMYEMLGFALVTVDNMITKWRNFKTKVSEVVTAVKNFFIDGFNSVKEFVIGTIDSISNKIESIIDRMKNFGEVAKGYIFNGTPDVYSPKYQGSLRRQSLVGLSTGGYVKSTGLAVLHPNEVVVNDRLTKQLKDYLEVSKNNHIPENAKRENKFVAYRGKEDGESRRILAPFGAGSEKVIRNSRVSNSSINNNDYSVHFGENSINITLRNGSESEIKKVARKVIAEVERENQLRGLAKR